MAAVTGGEHRPYVPQSIGKDFDPFESCASVSLEHPVEKEKWSCPFSTHICLKYLPPKSPEVSVSIQLWTNVVSDVTINYKDCLNTCAISMSSILDHCIATSNLEAKVQPVH